MDAREQYGPFCLRGTVESHLNATSAEVAALVEEGALLEATTSDGVKVYPAFQFALGGQLNKSVSQIVRLFHDADMNPWTTVYWLTTPNFDLYDMTPVEWIKSEADHDKVNRLAVVAIARWSTP